MKRRRFVQALAGTTAAQALLAQQPANQSAPGVPLNPAVGIQPPASAADELPKLEVAVADIAADPSPRFFSPLQFGALRRLSGSLMPGAAEARTPEFLDFLLSESSPERQRLYREGLDALNAQSRSRFGKPVADADDTEITALLAPLRQVWTYGEPADAAARFLRAAKVDVRLATTNSPDFSSGRRFAGTGQYWFPLD